MTDNTDSNKTNKKNEIMELSYKIAYEYDQKYGSCPQCVLAAIQETMGFISDDIIKAAHALSGGGALAGDGTCGALSGGMLAISCLYGRERKEFAINKSKPFKLSKKLHDKFVQTYEGVTCHGVQKKIFGRSFNMWDANEYKEFENQGGHRDKCTSVTGNVAKWVAEILINEEENLKGK